MKKLRVLVLAAKHLIPPTDVKEEELTDAPWRTEHYVISTLKNLNHQVEVLGIDSDLRPIRDLTESFKPHVAFNLLEAFDGETLFDHNVVSFLELIKQPYTGCNPKGLLIARDKSLSKKLLNYHRIKTPQFAVAKRGNKFRRPSKLEFPLIVKSLTEEGSVGISQCSIVHDENHLIERINFVHQHTLSDAIVESYIEGEDLYVSIFGNKKVTVLPFLTLEFKDKENTLHKIATSKVKWNSKYRSKHQIDLAFKKDIDNDLKKRISSLSKKIYRILGLSGYARLDFRLSNNELYFLEANPNPDIADTDEFAISAQEIGISYAELLNRIVHLGESWNPVDIY